MSQEAIRLPVEDIQFILTREGENESTWISNETPSDDLESFAKKSLYDKSWATNSDLQKVMISNDCFDYSFFWVGKCSRDQLEKIEQSLRKVSKQLDRKLSTGYPPSASLIEHAISPLLADCVIADRSTRKLHSIVVMQEGGLPFVIVGPKGEGTGILVRSSDADYLLLGSAARPDKVDKPRYRQMFHLIPWTGNRNRVFKVESKNRRTDASYRLLWKASYGDHFAVEKDFERILPELESALFSEDYAKIEWILTPVLTSCILQGQNYEARSAERRAFVLVYWVIVLGVAAALAFKFADLLINRYLFR